MVAQTLDQLRITTLHIDIKGVPSVNGKLLPDNEQGQRILKYIQERIIAKDPRYELMFDV